MIQTNLALKKLNGIKPKGVKLRAKTNFEKLFEIENILFEEYPDSNSTSLLHNMGLDNKLINKCFVNLDFSESDLINYIESKLGFCSEEYEEHVVGCYTGRLLSHLCDLNRKKGKPTIFHIDGRGEKFNYLLNDAWDIDIDTVIVENFKGEDICNEFAFSGNVNLAIFRNLGEDSVDKVGYRGQVDLMVADNIQTSFYIQTVGGYNAHPNLVIAKNFNEEFLINRYDSSQYSCVCARSGVISIEDSVGHFNRVLSLFNLEKLLLKSTDYTVEDDKFLFNKLFTLEEHTKEYEQLREDLKIDEILYLADETKGKSKNEIIELTNQMKTIYEEIKHLL